MNTKGANWADEELRHLLVIWAQPEIQEELNSKLRNKPIFARMAAQLARDGFAARDGQACREKINRIRREYRLMLDSSRKSGQGNEDDLPCWFEIVHAVLKNKPSTSPVATYFWYGWGARGVIDFVGKLSVGLGLTTVHTPFVCEPCKQKLVRWNNKKKNKGIHRRLELSIKIKKL